MIRRRTRILAALALCVLAGAAGWRVSGRQSDTPHVTPAPPPVDEIAHAARTAPIEAEPGATPARDELQPVAVAPIAGGIGLTLRFLAPDGKEMRVESSRVRLTDPTGRVVERSTEVAWSVDFAGLEPVRYAVDVRAPGFTHRPEEIDLSGHKASEGGLREGLTLWSKFCIAVVVQDQVGRPLSMLAQALGIEPKQMFVDGFSARVLSENPGGAGAEFLKPPNYQQWEVSESVVGSLVLAEPPPVWVELDFHGLVMGKQRLEPQATEVVFQLSPSQMQKGLARLQLRVFEGQIDSPVVGANVTLRADTSAHRRRDQENVPTAPDGGVQFIHVVPGRYELLVENGDAQYQDRIDLAPGEQRDLGTVRVSAGAMLDIRVVDERGEAQSAWLEIAPYESGRDVRDLYPPMLHEYTRQPGVGQMRMPARASIVRAQQMTERGLGPSGLASASVRIDPASPPGAPVELVILDTARLNLSCRMPEARKLQLLDELGLIVLEDSMTTEEWKEHRRTLEIGRGRYGLRLLGVENAVVYQRTIVLRAGDQELELP